MKKKLLILFLFALSLHATAQDPVAEKLKQELNDHPQQDTFRVNRLNEMVFYSRDESYNNEALAISKKIGYATGEAYALAHIAFSKNRHNLRIEGDSMFHRADSIAVITNNTDLLATVQVHQAYSSVLVDPKMSTARLLIAEKTCIKAGNKKLLSICQYFIAVEYANGESNFTKGMEYYLKCINSAEEVNYLRYACGGYIAIAKLYQRMDAEENAVSFFQKAREINKNLKSTGIESQLLVNDAAGYKKAGKYADAIAALKKALEISKDADSVGIATMQSSLANAYNKVDSLSSAFKYEFISVRFAKKVEDNLLLAEVVVPLSETYLKNKMPDSAVYYARIGYDSSKKFGAVEVMRDNAEALANAYAYKKDFANAYAYHLLYVNHRDSVVNKEIRDRSALIQYNADLEKKQAQITALNQQKKIQQNFLYSSFAVLLLIIIIAVILLKSNRQKQKANKLLQKQKNEIESQRDQTNKVLEHLRQTQDQLIQSEKMASLGQLTAGIAHEIQNPLNFVNNFSDVNKELVDELQQELKAGKIDDAITISNDIKDNEEKINHHGKRADAIVKGMLQHSRTSTNQKELTDINALADEYLRLAYHGLRAKDKAFNTTMKTDFDETIDKINVVPQDIGRVLLNLYNNAFYAMNEKKKKMGDTFEPILSVSTKKVNGKVEIRVADNGNGISQNIVDKIFQPFFTTKPTGQGTGLGLSLSYDIIKTHGGEIKVSTEPGKYTEFIVVIPC